VRDSMFVQMRSLSDDDWKQIVALYDGEIAFTDSAVGELLRGLEERNLSDNTLIVLLADHGEEFFEHGGKGHHRTLFEEVILVPLIFRWPGRLDAGRVITDQVRLIDVMPTLLALAAVTPPVEVMGRDLSPLLQGDELPAEPALLELLLDRRQLRALRTNDYKIMVDDRAQKMAFFDLRRDPGEQGLVTQMNPLIEQTLAQLRATTRHTLAWRRRLGQAATRPADMSDDMIGRLRSLGYIGGEDSAE
jgi:arylsulfatase